MNAALKPVSFKKPVERLPRLSKPYMKGAPKHERFWSDDEVEIVKQHYPTGGAQACLVHLPNRGIAAVYRVAHENKLKAPRSGEIKRPPPSVAELEAIDQKIKNAWPGLSGRGAVTRWADENKIARRLVYDRALRMELTNPHKKELDWTQPELDFLEKVPLHDPMKAAEMFREHGWARSPSSIVNKSKRIGMSRRFKDGLSAHGAAEILGVDEKWITTRCIDGTIKAVKRETKRLPQQGGHPWLITRADLRAFVIEKLEQIDIRKVDKVAFVDLLVRQDEPK